MKDQANDTKKPPLWEILTTPPSEDSIYESECKQEVWTIDEFAALAVGLTPKKYKEILSDKYTEATLKEREQTVKGLKLQKEFLEYAEKELKDEIHFIGEEPLFYLSPWKYIKWFALKRKPITKKFFKFLPLILKELLIEFQPTNTALRTASKYSRDYHEALYLSHAEKIFKNNPHYKIKDLYNDTYLQNIQRMIRSYKGNYKKRTYTESWLPKLFKNKRGRPKKQ